MSKAKAEFIKRADTTHGGLTNLIDSLVKKGSQADKKQ